MFHLEPPDLHYFSAAVGWLGLDNPTEARAELDRLSPATRKKPDVLELEWAICAAEKDWKAALKTARTLIKTAPKRCTGWLHQAYSLRRIEDGGLQAAWDSLLPAAEKFPKESTVHYNLACYACQMDRMDEARKWFARALSTGEKHKIKEMALRDRDLRPMWDQIRKM